MTRARARRPASLMLSAATLLLVAACSGQDDSTSGSASGSSSTVSSATPTPSQSPSEDVSPSTSPSSSPSAKAHPTLASRLLDADRLPGFNAEYRWVQGTTAPEDPSTSFGTCQRFAITSIGAERVMVRRYRPAAAHAKGDTAGELVATFPDDLTARRAFAVLKAWRTSCGDRLGQHEHSKVGALSEVSVEGGNSDWYLLTYGPVAGDPDSQFFDAQGMAVVGTRIALVSMRLAGQDYNYESGQEPMVEAVQRAARELA